MEKTYLDHLRMEQKQASEEFEKAKENAIQEIKDLTPITAIDFGITIPPKIDKMRKAAENFHKINEALRVYEYYEKNKDET